MDAGAVAYRRFLEGDESGFDELVLMYHDNLIYFINRYVKNFAAAEDLAADTFMELLVHKNRYSFKSSFKTYLFSIAHHKTVDYLRHESRCFAVPAETADFAEDMEAVEQTVIADDQKRRVAAVAKTLTAEYATFIHLFYFEEMEQEEVAKIMRKTKKQMANLAFRAKKALQEALRKEGVVG